MINAIKEEIVTRVKDCSPQATNMADTLDRLVQETLGESPGTTWWWCVVQVAGSKPSFEGHNSKGPGRKQRGREEAER